MTVRSAVYWMATTLTAFSFLCGGAAYLYRAEFATRSMAALGYPSYLLTLLGLWKLLGALAILAPGLRRLKEWAYAGMAFDLTGAAFSHVAMGHPAKAIAPLVVLGMTTVSWGLRPKMTYSSRLCLSCLRASRRPSRAP